MKDVFDNELNVSDFFIYNTANTENCLRFGKVLGILDKKVKIITASKNLYDVWFIQISYLRDINSLHKRTFRINKQCLGKLAEYIDIYESRGFAGSKHFSLL